MVSHQWALISSISWIDLKRTGQRQPSRRWRPRSSRAPRIYIHAPATQGHVEQHPPCAITDLVDRSVTEDQLEKRVAALATHSYVPPAGIHQALLGGMGAAARRRSDRT